MVNNSCDLYVPVSFQLDYHFCPLLKSAAMPCADGTGRPFG